MRSKRRARSSPSRRPDPGRASRLRARGPSARRAPGRADARGLARLPRVASRTGARGLLDPASASRAEPRAAPRVRRVLCARGRRVRRPARRLRAGDEDGGGRHDLPASQGRPRAHDPGRRRDRAGRRLVPPRSLSSRRAAPFFACAARAVGDGPRSVAARPHRAPVRDVDVSGRHPPDDELPGGCAARDLLLPARVRPRHLRAAGRSGLHPNAALSRRLVGVPRVAEPTVGEPRRPQPLDVALLLPAVPGFVPRPVRRRVARDVPPGAQQGAADAETRRRGRGHVLPPYRSALRARTRAARRGRGAARPTRGLRSEDARLPRPAAARRRAGRAPGRPLVRHDDGVLPDVCARERRLGSALGAGGG